MLGERYAELLGGAGVLGPVPSSFVKVVVLDLDVVVDRDDDLDRVEAWT